MLGNSSLSFSDSGSRQLEKSPLVIGPVGRLSVGLVKSAGFLGSVSFVGIFDIFCK